MARSMTRCRGMLTVLILTLALAAEIANADFVWGNPTNLGPSVNSPQGEHGVCISADGLEFYFVSDRPGGYGGDDLWVRRRATVEDDWGSPVNAGSLANSQYGFWEPTLSTDGLSLYFSDGHAPEFGNHLPGGLDPDGNIWMVTRDSADDAWGPPVSIGPAVNSQHAVHPSLSADGLSLYLQSHRPGHIGSHCDIMVATRETTSDPFGNPVFLRNINSATGEWMPDISADGRTLFFGRGNTELWMARRETDYDDFEPPVKLPPQINLACANASPTLSPDGRTLYFGSDRPGGMGGYDLWQVSITPVVDFNADGTVDTQDLLRLIESWGQNDPAVDIGPTPFGDGTVDEKDLEILMSYWGQEIYGPTLAAYWKLDEEEGAIVADSAGVNDATVIGDALWQPEGGKLGGAMQFDGATLITADMVLNPADGPFSVFAWVKGGAPDQAILSQQAGADWLLLDAATGALMTGLKSGGRFGKALSSNAAITDGDWHRVGFTWDGLNRILYVDDIEVAKDTQTALLGSYTGLCVGAGSTLAPGSFWSGLIDDVRIYNRAVKP